MWKCADDSSISTTKQSTTYFGTASDGLGKLGLQYFEHYYFLDLLQSCSLAFLPTVFSTNKTIHMTYKSNTTHFHPYGQYNRHKFKVFKWPTLFITVLYMHM